MLAWRLLSLSSSSLNPSPCSQVRWPYLTLQPMMGLFSLERNFRSAFLECSSVACSSVSEALNSWEPLARVNPASCSYPAPSCLSLPSEEGNYKTASDSVFNLPAIVLLSAFPSSWAPSSQSPRALFMVECTAAHCRSCSPPTAPCRAFRSSGT